MLHRVPALKDNYIWLLETSKKRVVIVDPGESKPVIDYLVNHHLTPVAIILTHHHKVHIDGVMALLQHYRTIKVYGPLEVPLPITHISDKAEFFIDEQLFNIIPVPGHTLGHIAYYCAPYLFCGDTLFSAGCGSVFERSYQPMFQSLNKLKQLPNDTIVCPAHEYTINNLQFALTILPDDRLIKTYYQQIRNQLITLPTTMLKEKQINLFLRCDEQNLQHHFNISNALDLFTFLRIQKDNF